MGRKGGSSHLKRLASPEFWPIHRKEDVWTVKPSPGPHPIGKSIPLLVMVRDIFNLAKTSKEAESIINEGKIKVDGRVRKDKRFPVGVMDVIDISDLNRAYRMTPTAHRFLTLHQINEEEKTFKLCRIEDKKIVKDGFIQLNLHCGGNISLKPETLQKSTENLLNVLDVVKINLLSRELMDHFKFEEGVYAIITSGKNIGKHGTITYIEKTPFRVREHRAVKVKDENGVEYNTIPDYVFVVGDEKPAISLPRG